MPASDYIFEPVVPIKTVAGIGRGLSLREERPEESGSSYATRFLEPFGKEFGPNQWLYNLAFGRGTNPKDALAPIFESAATGTMEQGFIDVFGEATQKLIGDTQGFTPFGEWYNEWMRSDYLPGLEQRAGRPGSTPLPGQGRGASQTVTTPTPVGRRIERMPFYRPGAQPFRWNMRGSVPYDPRVALTQAMKEYSYKYGLIPEQDLARYPGAI